MTAWNAPERKVSEVKAKPGQPEEDRQEQLHEEGRSASSDSHTQYGPVCHSDNKSRSSSAEGEAEKNQGLQEEDEQSRTPEEQVQTARQQGHCSPCEGSPEARLLSTNKGKGLIQRVSRRGMEQLGPSMLELGTETHDELVHTTRLIMVTVTGA